MMILKKNQLWSEHVSLFRDFLHIYSLYKDSPWVSLWWRRFEWDAVHIYQAFSNMHYHMRLKQQSVTKTQGSHVQYEKKIPLAYYSCLNGKLDFSSSAFRPESSREWIPTINVAFHWLVFETHFRRPDFFFIWLIFFYTLNGITQTVVCGFMKML